MPPLGAAEAASNNAAYESWYTRLAPTLYMKIAIAVLILVLTVGWLGFQVRPLPFAPFAGPSADDGPAVPVPPGLPQPVASFYASAYGDTVPVVDSAVITGRGRIRPFGLWMPARFRFTHDAGKGYRHYIEATWFGLPIMKVNESYLGGEGRMELPWATATGPEIEQAMNVSMWAELSSAAPSVFLTDPRVSWEPIDAETAVLRVPFGEGSSDTFVVRFDPAGGRIESMAAMRFKNAGDERKVLWTTQGEGERTIGHAGAQAVGSATWQDQGRPWAYFETEDIRYNVDVSEYIRQRGL